MEIPQARPARAECGIGTDHAGFAERKSPIGDIGDFGDVHGFYGQWGLTGAGVGPGVMLHRTIIMRFVIRVSRYAIRALCRYAALCPPVHRGPRRGVFRQEKFTLWVIGY